MNSDGEWGTTDEIRFIKTTNPKGISRLQFLLNYKEALQCRTNLGDMKKGSVIKALNAEINHERHQ